MDSEEVKQTNYLRFGWHERVLRDAAVRRRPIALAFAGLIMHTFSPNIGYAELSLRAAARSLGCDKTSVIRARDFLVTQGWLQLAAPTLSGPKHQATRYTLAGGPEDLDLVLHAAGEPQGTDVEQASLW